MKTSLFFLTAMFFVLCSSFSVAQWQPAGERIRTRWGEALDPRNVWNVYPRPLLERTEWKSLNGPWSYAIGPRHSARPDTWDGEILVPFPVESSLSGVKRTVGDDKVVWYERNFTIPPGWRGRDILLHFGAVDWQADVWVNDIRVGTHTGGYTAFYFNITPYLNSRGTQKVVVRVWDPTDKSFQPRGKQVSEPHGIWYTAVTGIWQTVWIEPVDRSHITRIRTTPDIDLKKVSINIETSGNNLGDYAEVRISAEGRVVSNEKFAVSGETDIYLDSPKLWSPESPFLYDLEITLYSGGRVTDRVRSYFAMRKISTGRDRNGIVRIRLNNEDYFPMGTLDQGWWPDGLYTPPSDEAMLYDIEATKDLGFNMIRKHVKVEPARWYMHCDRAGILVWQDMPSGDQTPVWQMRQYFDGTELKRSSQSETNFRKEWKEVIDLLYSHPSIVTWIPFNEAWGQFKTREITEWTKNYDPSRLILPASGGNHFQTGDILGIHNYPQPVLYLYDATRPTVLSEFGGIGLALDGHLWEPDRNWGYIQFSSVQEVTKKYLEYAEELKKLIRSGISGAVYTQTTDVEIEVNGLMTYDRRLIKMDRDMIRQANMEIRKILEQGPAR
jgi:beta-galactosidase/beta-glucuronidase